MSEKTPTTKRPPASRTLIYAISNVVWYNGLEDTIKEWKNIKHPNYSAILPVPDEVWEEDNKDLQAIWMICVSMFGDYGTSPRGGWIEDVEEFCDFIDAITSRQDDVYDYDRR